MRETIQYMRLFSMLSSIWEPNSKLQDRELPAVSELLKGKETNKLQMSKQAKIKNKHGIN